MTSTFILVADDDPVALAFFCEALAGPGRTIEGVSTGAELAQRLATRRADLVVSDLAMPWMDGLAAVEAARSAGLATPFVLVTGHELPRWGELARRLAPVRLLRKPVGVWDLRACVEQLLPARGGPG